MRLFVQVSVVDRGTDGDGTRRRAWSAKFATQAEAKRHRDLLAGAVARSGYVAPTRQTLAAFVRDDWLPVVHAEVRSSTFESYERDLRLHVLPRLGHLRLPEITVVALNQLYVELLASGRVDHRRGEPLAPRSVRYVHTIVHRVLRDAVRWQRLAHNPASDASPGRARARRRHEITTWTAEEVQRFLAASRQHRGRGRQRGDRLYAAWVLLLTTGLRRGELLGLRCADVDFERVTLAVRQTVVTSRRDGRKTVELSAPKTASGHRVVALDPGTLGLLLEHRRGQDVERAASPGEWQEHGLAFPARDGRPFHPDRFSREFTSRVERYGSPAIRLHDLRHTHATLALQQGVHPKVVSERLGHSVPGYRPTS